MSAYGRLARELRRQRQARKLRRKALDALDASEMVFARKRTENGDAFYEAALNAMTGERLPQTFSYVMFPGFAPCCFEVRWLEADPPRGGSEKVEQIQPVNPREFIAQL